MSSLFFLFLIFRITTAYDTGLHSPSVISAGPTYGSYKFNVLHHLAGISLYFESNAEELSPDPPEGCTVDKAIYQVRHGAIYVNEYDFTQTIRPFLQRMKSSSKDIDFKSNDLAFLANWTSPISNSEEQVAQVSKLGFLESFSLGTRLAYRYPHLIPTKKDISFKLWGSDSNRTRHSADALFAGLYAGRETIGRMVVVSEDLIQGADTLTPTKTCPKFDVTTGTKQADIWLEHYTVPTIARLNAKVSGFRFSPYDVLAMQELCGYETISRGSSPLCGIFTTDEWLSFEYYFDIKYYYELGYGSNLSPSLGMPWVVATSDLLSRTNSKDQHLYISVSHRQIPPLILTALGLYNDSEYFTTPNFNSPLPNDRINYQRAWKTSSFITFLGQIALERLTCTSAAYNGSFVRILVSSIPKRLPGCESGPGASCPLKQYRKYVMERNGLYERFSRACGVEDKNVPDVLSIFVK